MPKQRVPKRGDVVEVDWVDIWEDPTGDPDAAYLSRRKSVGLYWGPATDEDTGIEILVTSTTRDDGSTGQEGFCAYPAGCVLGVKVIRRAKKGK